MGNINEIVLKNQGLWIIKKMLISGENHQIPLIPTFISTHSLNLFKQNTGIMYALYFEPS